MKTVYLLRNDITGKVYVGVTGGTVGYRVAAHIRALRGGRHSVEMMQEDSHLFGPESFSYRTFGAYPNEEADRMEVFMMKVLRTQDPRFGYNYKDKAGINKNAIKDRWRTPKRTWCDFWRQSAKQR